MKIAKELKRLLDNQQAIYIAALVVLMLPNVVLSVTDHFHKVELPAFFLLPLAFYMLLMLLFRKPGYALLLFTPLLILSGGQLVLLYLFGGSIISVDMFLNFTTSNTGEAGELISTIWPLLLSGALIYIPFIFYAIWSIRNPVKLTKRFVRIAFVAALCCLVAGGISVWRSYQTMFDYAFRTHVYPYNILENIEFAGKKLWRTENYPAAVADFSFGAKKNKESGQREVYVLVIGETSRAFNWSLYGYDRQTNPYLSADTGLVVCRDVLTQANITHRIVPIILSAASAENYNVIYDQKSLISAFKEAGFKTCFLSNQGANRSFIDYFAAEADTLISLRQNDNNRAVNPYDTDLLPELDKLIHNTTDNLCIVLHTYGSHFEYNMRYPKAFSQFTPDQARRLSVQNRQAYVNAYDNSILYTDYFLHQIIEQLRKSDCCTAMLYLSDHGEDIMDDSRSMFLHCSPIPTVYQLYVPFLFWFSDGYASIYPDKVGHALQNSCKPFASNVVFHSFIDLADIQTPYVDTTLSVLRSGFIPGERCFISDHDRPILIRELGLKEDDMRQIRRLNITY